MKKTLFIIFAAASALLLSCQKGFDGGDSSLRELRFEAGSSDFTKSHYNGTGRQEWSYGDRMNVFDGYGKRSFLTYTSGATASFCGPVAADASSIVAVYPESAANAYLSATSVAVGFPVMQIASKGGFTDGSNPMVGKAPISDNISMDMRNVGSYLEFTIPDGTGIDLSSVYIVSGGEEMLSGVIPVDVSGDTPVASAGSGYHNVALVPDAESDHIAPGTYFAVVPPVTLASGLSFVAKRTDGKVGVKSGTTSNTLVRNASKNLGTIDISAMEWSDAEEFSDLTMTLDFSSASVFTEALPSSKTIGTKTYKTPDGKLFTISIDDSNSNTRGPGWMVSDGRFVMFNNSYYRESPLSTTTDGITLPSFPALRLKSVTIDVGKSNTFQAVVLNPDGSLVKGGMDEDATNWQKGTTHTLALKGTQPGVSYKICAKAANTFIYIAKLTLTYERLGLSVPTQNPTGSIADITDNGDIFVW